MYFYGTTSYSKSQVIFKIYRSRAFRICSQSVWELKIHKIRLQGTVKYLCPSKQPKLIGPTYI